MGGKWKWVLLLAWALANPLGAEAAAQESGGVEFQLQGSLQAVMFEDALGSRLRRAHKTEPEVLNTMFGALRIVARSPEGQELTRTKVLGHRPVITLDLGKDRGYSFSIAGRNQLHSKEWGRLTFAPNNIQVVEHWISELEQTRVCLNVDNPFPEERLEKLIAFQELDDRPWQEAQIAGPVRRVWVHGPQALKGLQEGFQGIYVPSRSVAGDSWGYSVKLHSWVGGPVGFTWVDATRCATQPLHAVLLCHETQGAVWVGDAFRDLLPELHSPSVPVQEGAEDYQPHGLQDVRKEADLSLQGPPQVLLHRGVVLGAVAQQHFARRRWQALGAVPACFHPFRAPPAHGMERAPAPWAVLQESVR
jgi:hypothetical protein